MDWQETRKLRSGFLSMDKNHEGWITAEDFQDLMQQAQDWMPTSNDCPVQNEPLENPKDIFAALDPNRHQRIYYSEFMAATAKVCRQTHRQALKATFARLD